VNPTPAPVSTQQLWGEGWLGQMLEGTASPLVARTPAPAVTPAPASNYGSALRNGDEGEDVRYVQQRLKELGYLSGSVDGQFGNNTENAVKAFQRANGLSADGVVGDRTMAKLRSSSAVSGSQAQANSSKATDVPAPKTYVASTPSASYGYLAPGDSGSKVRTLQNRLRELGYMEKAASGQYDGDTEEAVRAFQKRNGLWVDGRAGPDTQSVLFSSKALAARN